MNHFPYIYTEYPTLIYLVGGFNHLEKYESQWDELADILWKIKNVRNHQPDFGWSNIYNFGTLELMKFIEMQDPQNHRFEY